MLNKIAALVSVAALTVVANGCSTYGGYQPTVDPYNDPNYGRIEQDKAECDSLAKQAGSVGTETEPAPSTWPVYAAGSRIWREIRRVRDPARRRAAARILARLLAGLAEFSSTGVKLPNIHTRWNDDDESLVTEVRLDMRRLGIAFEREQGDSGWYIVDIRPGRERRDSGALDHIDVSRLLRAVML